MGCGRCYAACCARTTETTVTTTGPQGSGILRSMSLANFRKTPNACNLAHVSRYAPVALQHGGGLVETSRPCYDLRMQPVAQTVWGGLRLADSYARLSAFLGRGERCQTCVISSKNRDLSAKDKNTRSSKKSVVNANSSKRDRRTISRRSSDRRMRPGWKRNVSLTVNVPRPNVPSSKPKRSSQNTADHGLLAA